jgi:hypothetical protein
MRSTPQNENTALAGCAEARRLIALANQRLRVLEPDAAALLLQAALDALPRGTQSRSGAKRTRSVT